MEQRKTIPITERTHYKNGTPRKRDRWGMFNAFVDFGMRELSASESMLWLVLFRFANGKRVSSVSISTLAKVCPLQDRQLRKLLKSLEHKDFLEKLRPGNSLTHTAAAYRLKIPQNDK